MKERWLLGMSPSKFLIVDKNNGIICGRAINTKTGESYDLKLSKTKHLALIEKCIKYGEYVWSIGLPFIKKRNPLFDKSKKRERLLF